MIKPHLSPNQQKCYLYDESFVITYAKDIPRNPVEAAIEVIDVVEVLRAVFEPTSADLRVGCFRKSDRQKNSKVDPPTLGWHIRSSDLPEEMKLIREFDYKEDNSSPDFKVSKLSKPVMIDWVKKALNQKCPYSETYDIAWSSLNFNTVRTRIFTEELLAGQEMMRAIHESRHGYYELEYPLLKENDQLWVYSPLPNSYRFSTFRIRVNHIDWQEIMELNIDVNWSWWTQEGFKERDVLLETIPQIEALGWDLEFFDDLDAAYVPREA